MSISNDIRAMQDSAAVAKVCVGPGWGWIVVEKAGVRISFKGYLHDGGRTIEGRDAAERAGHIVADVGTLDMLDRAISSLNGHFALVVETPQRVVACVDRIRSTPLLWGMSRTMVHIDDRGRRLKERLGYTIDDVDFDQALSIATSGYAIGGATLYKGMRQLRPGEALVVEGGLALTRRWFIYDAWRTEVKAAPDRRLSELHRSIIERLAASANGRPICIPLSAGLDSRMIASGLKEVGYRDVRLFAYGRSGNHEVQTSKMIAERLGYPWTFVRFTDANQRALFRDKRHEQLLWNEIDSCGCVPFEQDWIAIAQLKEKGWIPADAIIVNGQTGDFITGNHVPKAFLNAMPPQDLSTRREQVISGYIDKHHAMWRVLSTPQMRARIGALLESEIQEAGAQFEGGAALHGIYEFLEYQDRQAKYVVSGQRTYEAMRFTWRLPLWDDEYINFWRHAQVELKAQQNLYRRVLEADNWGDVWKDLPVNAKTIRPRWLVPLRLTAKIAFAPFGAERWHRAERRLFGWWMDSLRVSAIVPYSKALADNRGPRNAIGWLIERYLGMHNVRLDDLVVAANFTCP